MRWLSRNKRSNSACLKKHDRRWGATTNEVSRIREAGDYPAGAEVAPIGTSDSGKAWHSPYQIYHCYDRYL